MLKPKINICIQVVKYSSY